MGIVIIPFLLLALVPSLISFVKALKLLFRKQLGLKEIALGLVCSALLFGLICLSYILEGKAWGLSPAFRIPIFMIFIPFGIQILTAKSKKPELAYTSKILLISIALSSILGLIFHDVLFELIDILGIEKHY